MYTGFESFTDDELIARLPGTGKLGEELAVRLEARQDQLEQAGKALAAARELQDVAGFLVSLPLHLQKLETARKAFSEADDGELGA